MKLIDLTNKKYGDILVIQRVYNPSFTSKHPRWLVRCGCGREYEASGSCIRSGRNKRCKSCGRPSMARDNHPSWTGYEKIGGQYWNHIKRGAKSRNLPFTVTIEEGWRIYKKQNEKCVLTGWPINFASRVKKYDGTASLDRIDSNNGYIDGNIQWVHKDINKIKQNFTEDYFITMCKAVAVKHGYT